MRTSAECRAAIVATGTAQAEVATQTQSAICEIASIQVALARIKHGTITLVGMQERGLPHTQRWLMISLAFFATLVNYLDRQTLSVVAPVLLDQFHMNSVEYSRVVSAFLLAYTIMNAVSGPLIDRLGTRTGYAICMAWWSVSSILHVFARGAFSLGVFRFLLGMGEAGNWPAGVKVVAEWFPENERALASGIFNSGSTIGVILAPPVIAMIVLNFGWRAAFFSIGCLGFAWLVAWLLIYRTPVEATSKRLRPTPVARLLRTRFVWALTLSKVFLDPAWYFYVFWFPEYLKQVHHFNLAAIGRYAWIPFFVAALGNLVGGFLSPAIMRRGVATVTARKIAVTVCTLLMLCPIAAVLSGSPWVATGCVAVAMAGYTGANVTQLAVTADAFGKESVASVWGFASTGAGFGGMLCTLIAGWVIQHFSYAPVFVGFGLIPLVCSAILWMAGPLPDHELQAG
jgi:ACS family hexuronate transporter-like MFS transporter